MNNYIKVFGSIALGTLFLWLAFKGVSLDELKNAASGMRYTWVAPFIFATLLSHLVRALRWQMLFTEKEKTPAVFTLFTGVMFGYLTNIALPRVGEVTRPVYVARQTGQSSSKLIGTIVLERVIDVLGMLLIMLFVGFFLISDAQVLSRLFGIDFTDANTRFEIFFNMVLYGIIAIAGVAVFYWIIKQGARKSEKVSVAVEKGSRLGRTFLNGLWAIKQLKNWPLFIFYTAAIWALYILMTYLGFWMFDMHIIYGLGMAEALVLTMVSAVGLTIPTPGGLGTYHLFITQSLFILYGVPEAVGLAYATVSHASTIVIVVFTSPMLLAVDKYVLLRREASTL